MRRSLNVIHNDLRETDVMHVMRSIREALVLLECAQDKLMHALPTEEFMSRKDLVEWELAREKRR
jgi:hypothetical protein